MADVLAGFVVDELAAKPFAFLKAVFDGKNYGPWTFIGKHYKDELTDNEQQRLPIIRNVIYHNDDDEEAASTWPGRSCMSNIYHNDDDEEAGPPSFGPVYRGLGETWKNTKQEAWQYVLRTSDDEGGADQTKQRYIEAIRRVEVESRVLYGGDSANYSSVASLSSDEFIWIMILDGCFLLRVALFVLGGSKQQDYPINAETFGKPPRDKGLIRAVISSMFIVGNQIPTLVLKELMKQSFFKKIVEQGKWQQPLDLERRVLFEQILVPMLDVKGGDIFIPTASMKGRPINWFDLTSIGKRMISSLPIYVTLKMWRNPSVIEASDLLKGLSLLMSGLSPRNKGGDFDHQINSYDVIHQTVRSATELKEAGITFMCTEGTSIKEISFQENLSITILMLPKIIIGSEMEILFSNLIQYEVNRADLGGNRREICGYLQLLRELIRTHDDVKLLAANGIIIVDPNEEEKLPQMFRKLDIPKVNVHGNLRKVRNELINYTSSINRKLGNLLSLVALLTVIQTVYSVLSYHFK